MIVASNHWFIYLFDFITIDTLHITLLQSVFAHQDLSYGDSKSNLGVSCDFAFRYLQDVQKRLKQQPMMDRIMVLLQNRKAVLITPFTQKWVTITPLPVIFLNLVHFQYHYSSFLQFLMLLLVWPPRDQCLFLRMLVLKNLILQNIL